MYNQVVKLEPTLKPFCNGSEMEEVKIQLIVSEGGRGGKVQVAMAASK